jgi:putative flippase GtrA
MIDQSDNARTQTSVSQLLRYALVGIANNSVGYLVYLCLTYLGAAPKLTMTLLYVVGAGIGYAGNKRFTFMHRGNVMASGTRYAMAHFFGYLVNLILLVIFVDHLGYAHQWVQAMAIFVVAGYLFLAFKYFVFTGSTSMNSDQS